ncbi:TnsA endonuclease N-terminal domain-containing protein [Trichocoleus sp. DQ-A3]|uniref:TnsA endonuclease C-terminal domain-containing protein n=1 Tax=Cyanophyceae TaxID=3028117 RepID=UPI0016876E33|nr:TnsA endonuclease C-terminal domain-containing protein [Coleofasciculus sp. FACHB-125]MBD1898897.1 TnsA endonuclease N-terminal domain-containing protein [Coleofasciculus sp. FACHB-125]
MAKRKRQTDQTVIDKRISDGRGQGRGSDYKPWLLVQDVSSQGLATRIKGWKTKRVHHFLSNLELSYFYILEWSLIVFDIREQYPLLPLEETLAIAEQCGIRHPTDPKTKEPIVMTTDFFITVPQNIAVIEQARTLKTAKDLQSKRTVEKLEIERCYWQNRNIDWGIVTEQEIPQALAKNVAWLHTFFRIEDLSPLSETEIRHIATALTLRMAQGNAVLTDLTAECDGNLGLKPGTALSVSRHLIANRRWLVDMNKPIQPSKSLLLLTTPLVEPFQAAGGAG